MAIPASSVIRITERTVLQKQLAQARTPAEKQYYLKQLQKMEKQIPAPPPAEIRPVAPPPMAPPTRPPPGPPSAISTERYAEITTKPAKRKVSAEQVNKGLKAIKMLETMIKRTPNKQVVKLLEKQIKAIKNLISTHTVVPYGTVGPLAPGYTYEKPSTIEKAIHTQVKNLNGLTSYIKEVKSANVAYFLVDGVKTTKQKLLINLSKNVMLIGNSIKELHKLMKQRIITDPKTGKKTFWNIDVYPTSGNVELKPDWNRIPDADKFFYPGAKEYFKTLPYSEKERILTKKSIDTNVNFYVAGEFAISNSGIPYFKKRVESKLKEDMSQRQAIIEVMLDNQIEPSESAERALDTMSGIEKNISAFRRTSQEFVVGTLIGMPIIAEMVLEEGVGRLHSAWEGKGLQKKEYLPIREVVAPYIFKKAVIPYYGPNVGVQFGTGIESIGREITGAKAPEGFDEQVKEQERLKGKYPSMQLASIGGAVFGTAMGTMALTKTFQIGGIAKGKTVGHISKVATKKFPKFTKAFAEKYETAATAYQKYKPSAYISRQVKKGFHKYVPPEKIFSKTVIQKKGHMEMFKGDVHDYFKHLKKFRQPDGTVPLVHGAHTRFATEALRQRVTAIIIKDGKVLMVSHTKTGPKTYMLPGGGVGKKISTTYKGVPKASSRTSFELPKRALAREIAEEVGLKVKTSKHLFDVPDYPSGNLYKVYKVTVTGTAKKLHETTGLKWVSIKDLSASNLDDFVNVYNMIKTNPKIKHIAIDLDKTLVSRTFKHGKYVSSDIRPGAIKFVKTLKSEGYKVTIWSHGKKVGVMKSLKETGLHKYVDDVITREHYAMGKGVSTTKDISKIGADILIDDNPAVFAKEYGGIQIQPYFGKVGAGQKAWHVKVILDKYVKKDFTSPGVIGQTKVGYPEKFIVGAGERPYSPPGMYFTLKGELGTWAFKIKRLTTKYGYGPQHRIKPAILETRGTHFTRFPKSIRYDAKATSDYLKHVHQKQAKFYTTTKLEKNLLRRGIAESEWLLPPGTGMLKKPTGFISKKPTTFKGKWYNWWAKRTGYGEFTIHPRHGKILPIRKYETFMPDELAITGKISKTVVSPKEMAKMSQMSTAYADLMSGVQYKPYYSPSYVGGQLLKSPYGSVLRPSKPSYPSYKPPYYSTTYPSYKSPYYSKPYYPSPSAPTYPSTLYPYKTPSLYPVYPPYPPSYTSPSYSYPAVYPVPPSTPPIKPIIIPEEKPSVRAPSKSYHAYSNGRRLTKKPLSRKQALGVGATHTDKTLSTRFHLKESNEPAGNQPRHSKTWSNIQHKFTTTNKNAYKEKPKYQKDFDIERQRFMPLRTSIPSFKAKSPKKHTSTLKKGFDPFKTVKINIGGIK